MRTWSALAKYATLPKPTKATDVMQYRLYYWPIPFRGNFVRLLFAYLGIDYEEASSAQIADFRSSSVREQPTPAMAPPVLQNLEDGSYVSQTGAIILYVGQRHGLLPDDPAQLPMVMKIFGDCMDVLSEITRSNGAQMWEREAWESFQNKRLVRWLEIFEEIGRRSGMTMNEGHLLGGEKVSVADLNAYALWATMERCLPQMRPTLRRHAPMVMALCDRLGDNPGIAAFVRGQEQDLSDRYCGGMIEASIRKMLTASEA